MKKIVIIAAHVALYSFVNATTIKMPGDPGFDNPARPRATSVGERTATAAPAPAVKKLVCECTKCTPAK